MFSKLNPNQLGKHMGFYFSHKFGSINLMCINIKAFRLIANQIFEFKKSNNKDCSTESTKI